MGAIGILIIDQFNPARGGQGFNSPPLGAFNLFVFDTPLLAAG
jgi:hypothetical protein